MKINIVDIFNIISYIIAIASIIVKFTPTETDNKILDKIIKILAVISLNK